MERQEIAEKVIAIIQSFIDQSSAELNMTTSLRGDTAINSLEFISIIMKLEEEFDIVIDEDEIPKLISIEDIVNLIEKEIL